MNSGITLRYPMTISSRLLPAVDIDNVTVSLDPQDWTIYIDGHGDWADIEHIDQTFRPGALSRDDDSAAVREAMGAVFSFLSAFAEAVESEERTGRDAENSDLFPDELREWAFQNSDELTGAAMALEDDDEE